MIYSKENVKSFPGDQFSAFWTRWNDSKNSFSENEVF